MLPPCCSPSSSRATAAHTLAAVYIGVSVGFGHRMTRWAGVRFAHRYAGGPAPAPKPRAGAERARHERRAWARHLLAWAVGVGLMLLAVAAIGDADRTGAFLGAARLWTVILVVDGIVAWSFSARPQRG